MNIQEKDNGRAMTFLTRNARWQLFPETLTAASWLPIESPQSPDPEPTDVNLEQIFEVSEVSDNDEQPRRQQNYPMESPSSPAKTVRAITPPVLSNC